MVSYTLETFTKMKTRDFEGVSPATCGEIRSDKTGKSWMEKETVESESSVKLDARSTSNTSIKLGFTAYQLHELQTQAIVYRYIASGLPVPLNLALSIWESLVATSRSEYRAMIYNYYSKYMMDPEPRRCRRTDGKKWRCGQDAIPDQKYCERHMHRGCKRSRKLVEFSQIASSSEGKAVTVRKDSSLNLVTPSPREAPAVTLALPNRSFTPTTCNESILPGVTIAIGSNKSMSDCVVDGKNLNCKAIDGSSQFLAGCYGANKGNTTFGVCVPPELDFSPKSVIQELGTGRCGRTDGKKWRCKKEVVAGQKYCVKHMHRGAKKKAARDSKVSSAYVAIATTTIKGKERNAAVDTTRSISVLANPESRRPEVLSSSSFSSDTTISDAAMQGEAFGEITSTIDAKKVKHFL